jgi:antitoxin component of RelBE/YafQ-DinJ toxin-antitoxin module
MSDSSTIHIPLEPRVRKQFTQKAKALGFDSAQAYLRVLIKAVVDDRRIDLDIDTWGEPSDAAAERLNKAAEDAKKGIGLSKAFNNADDLVQDLLS